MTFAKNSLSSWVVLIILVGISIILGLVLIQPVCLCSPPGNWGQPQQHAVPGRVRPLLRALVPGLGDGPPDPADTHSREGPHTPLATHRFRLQIPAGRTPTAQQESWLNVHEDAHRP